MMEAKIKKEVLVEISTRKAAHRAGLGPPLSRAKEAELLKAGAIPEKVERTFVQLTPIEVMLTAMTEAWNTITEAGEPDLGARSRAVAIAAQAAPYVHPKLSSIEARVDVTNHEAALDALE